MAALSGISMANSTEFVLAAAYAIALQRQAIKSSPPVPASDATMSEETNVTRPSSSGWTPCSSSLSTEGFIPNFASTPYASDVAQNETLLSDLHIGDEETGRNTSASPSTDVRPKNNDGVSMCCKASCEVSKSVQRTKESTVREQTLDDPNLKTMSRRSRLYRTLRSRDYWEKEYAVQSQWIGKVITESFSRPAVVAYVMECWKTLTKIYSSLRIQDLIHQYLVNAVKLLEFLIHRGYAEVSTLMNEFFNKVMGTYLRKPRNMRELSPAWVQSREILRIVCQTPTSADVLFGLRATVHDLETAFLKTATADVPDRDLNFAAYVLDQISDLTSRLNQRIQQIQRKKSFGLLF